MNYGKLILVFAFGLAIAGCAHPTWVKPGASDQDLLTDQYYCERDVRQSNFGEQQESEAAQLQGGYAAAGDSIGTGIANLGAAIGRKEFFNRCMMAHGWRDQPNASAPAVAMPIAAQHPAVTLETAPDSPASLPACTADQLKLAKWAHDNGYQFSVACQDRE